MIADPLMRNEQLYSSTIIQRCRNDCRLDLSVLGIDLIDVTAAETIFLFDGLWVRIGTYLCARSDT